MATRSLIEKLNRLAHLTPDQIVTNLQEGGWVKGADFTPERISVWRGRQTRVWFPPIFDNRPSSGDCGLHDFAWDLPGLNHSLPTYYFILEEHFTGEYPNVD